MALVFTGCPPPKPPKPPVKPPSPNAVDDVPSLPPERPGVPPGERPPTGGGLDDASSAADDLVREGQSDDLAREAICFAYDQFYDAETGTFEFPPQDEFAAGVAEQFGADISAQYAARVRAYEVYDTLLALEDGELATVAADLGCL
jgi:hypothetical protein